MGTSGYFKGATDKTRGQLVGQGDPQERNKGKVATARKDYETVLELHT